MRSRHLMSISEVTVQRWAQELDSYDEWIRYDTKYKMVTRIYCVSSAFVEGICGTTQCK